MKKVIFALAIGASIVSCQKKEDTDPIDVSKTVYLKDKSWLIKAWSIRANVADSNSIADPTYYDTKNGCEIDNFIVFNSASRATIHEGASKCDQNAPDSTVYGYTLTDNEKHIYIFTNPDDPEHQTYLDGDIKYPSIDTFTVTYRLPSPSDSTVIQEFVRTYVKQN